MHDRERFTTAKQGGISKNFTSRTVTVSFMSKAFYNVLYTVKDSEKRIFDYKAKGDEHIVTEQKGHKGNNIPEFHFRPAPFTISLIIAEIHSSVSMKINRHRRLKGVRVSKPPFGKIKLSISVIFVTTSHIFNNPFCKMKHNVNHESQKKAEKQVIAKCLIFNRLYLIITDILQE